ncbi:hypothetical protein [Halopiger goleimassiliensis]|uniref:hypothetical protein n=1 Tax=Halopiger goleimassiliensis TaxID=1293048 RepID=UPI000677FFB3|nr:hypothetical protein [Halopiger goleimassiliensis]
MATEVEHACPECDSVGRRRADESLGGATCYLCLAEDCPVVEYTSDGRVSHEAGCPEMKRAVLTDRDDL